MTIPDGRHFSEMTAAEKGEWESIRKVVEGAFGSRRILGQVPGAMTFRETEKDRFRLGAMAFFNGRLDVLVALGQGVPIKDIAWRL